MDSKPHVPAVSPSVSSAAAKAFALSSSSPSAGSFLIRAPLTLDDDSDSDFESNGLKTASTGNTSVNTSDGDGGFESDGGFVSGEEFETASDRPSMVDPEEQQPLDENGVAERYKLSRPFMADLDGDSSEDSTEMMDNSDAKRVIMPIAQLSMDDDEFDESFVEEEMVMSEVEDGGYSGVVKVPGAVDASTTIKVALGIEGGGEDESFEFRNSDVLKHLESYSPMTAAIQDEVMDDDAKGPSQVSKALVGSLVGSKVVRDANSEMDEDIQHSHEKSPAIESLKGERIDSNWTIDQKIEKELVPVVGHATDNASEPMMNPTGEQVAVRAGEPINFQSYESSTADSGNGDDLHESKVKGERVLLSNDDVEELIFGSTDTTKKRMNDTVQESTSSLLMTDSQDHSEAIDRQTFADTDEEVNVDGEDEREELLDTAALVALLKAANYSQSDRTNCTTASTDDLREVTQESISFLDSSAIASPSNFASNDNIYDEERKRVEKIQHIRVKFLRLVQRLGHSPNASMVTQVLHRLALALGSHSSQEFSLESARKAASELEAEAKGDLDFSLNVLLLGKTGVGKSATVNSIFCEEKARIDAFKPATTSVKEIAGSINGIKIRILDTPGLRSTAIDESTNRKILASIKRFTKKYPPDIVLYVDRLDTDTRDLTDLPLLKLLTNSLGSSIWKNAIVTLTHAASDPPDGPSGLPLSYEVFVAQRSHVVQRAISLAVGDLRLMNPSMTHPVSLVENHPLCEKNGNGESMLPGGQIWRTQLLLLCYSMKILSEASSISKPQDPFDHGKLFGFRLRSLPLSYLLSSLLQSRAHPKLSADQFGDNDFDLEMGDSSESDQEDEDEYDRLPPFKPLRRSQVAELSKEERKAYFEEYDYRVKLLQKKQWREEVRRLREMKKKGKDGPHGYVSMEEDEDMEDRGPATVQVPLPDMVLPSSFDGDNPAYRYRFLDNASQLLVRPVLDSQVWDHDFGYDGVSLERNIDISNCYPGAFSVQITKDKKEFNIHLDSSICAKHGETGSTMAGFDIQTVGRQLAYILRGETKIKILKMNKAAAGFSVTLLGENVATGLKIEDQIAVGKRLVLAGSAGTMRCRGDSAYGANLELCLKDKDFPIEQDKTTLGLSLTKWRSDFGMMANLQSQFSIGHNSKMAVRVGMNNKKSGQITLKISSSESLLIALTAMLPVAVSMFRSIYPGSAAKSSTY